VITPYPRPCVYADKRTRFADGRGRLLSWGCGRFDTLLRGIPRTRSSLAGSRAAVAERRRLFFKPAAGHGSKAAYRGEKLTRRVWDEILAGRYVAQQLVVPGERRVGPDAAMKVDVRNYVYDGKVQLLAARLYQGQTTNMRTAGGGFAPVLTTPSAAADRVPPRAPRTGRPFPVAA
jgi:hypothetical protein